MHLADIIGIGRTKAAEHWNRSLVDLAVEACCPAIEEASSSPTAVVVGNALGGALGDQRNLSSYVSSRLGLYDAETHSVEADEASGGAALRLAIALIGAGLHETVLVVGAEKTTDSLPDSLEAARAQAMDVAREAGFGFGPTVAAALAMRRYIDEHKIDRSAFYHLSAVAHEHGALNEMAFLSWPLSKEQYFNSQVVAEPMTVCDAAPPCDGSAAVVVQRPVQKSNSAIRIAGSAAVSHRPGITGPALDLKLPAAERSAASAMSQAKIGLDDLSLFEITDSSSIASVLSIEAIGLARPGRALELAERGDLHIRGARPMWTFGGNKSRGNPFGASGLYQVVEAALQLRGDAGPNQVAGASTAFVQCLGSFGSTAVTHVLSA